ncbi:DEAD/DEAH box helicase [Cupriavidus sp. amp6]|uniref:DEAD/DEAH box helicase n=1 Tax=Cupriavidus sp. amp6 TaxID=388051 RepID=UPI000421ECCA|nr:DEAD/DEAH box helicase [Cupriavidus sp. amp6]
MLDFDALNAGGVGGPLLEPRKIFTTLQRSSKFRRPSDEQGEVLDAWFRARTQRDTTIKMNTGSGKTLVGLLALQSCLQEKMGPAVFMAADNYLAEQVLAEAKDLGVPVTQDETASAFLRGEAVLVVNPQKLFNGKSVFGLGASAGKIAIGSIVIDDAHACIAKIRDQFTLTISKDNQVYSELMALFRDDLKEQSVGELLDLEADDPQVVLEVPFWAWQDKQDAVLPKLHPLRDAEDHKFKWALVRDVLPLSQCVFGARQVAIAPRCLPVDVIPSFARAKRRIYMTATLADDGMLVSDLAADAQTVAAPIKPAGAGDMGDRMILAPQEINPQATLEEIQALVVDVAHQYNVVVIVPSHRRAEDWSALSQMVLTRENLSAGVQRLREGHVGIVTMVNRYDGVDLPDDACRLLVIYDLPQDSGVLERRENVLLDGSTLLKRRQIQRIEQGMGRGVRSSDDYCVVLLVGGRLTSAIHGGDALDMMSPATRAQIELGQQVTKQLVGKSVAELRPVISLCLTQDAHWREASKRRLAQAPGSGAGYIDPTVVKRRRAFDAAVAGAYGDAVKELATAADQEEDRVVKGYLLQQVAEYQHHNSPAQAQMTLAAAVKLNRSVVRPLQGIEYRKLNQSGEQAQQVATFLLQRFVEGADLVIWKNGLLEDLLWGNEYTSRFEAALQDVGCLLGFGSQRPEKDVKKGPDNLWAVGGTDYFVIECKTGSKSDDIAKSDVDQLAGSVNWFSQNYGKDCSAIPVMIHPRTRLDRTASAPAGMRVMSESELQSFKDALSKFVTMLAFAQHSDISAIANALIQFKLTKDLWIDTYTSRAR